MNSSILFVFVTICVCVNGLPSIDTLLFMNRVQTNAIVCQVKTNASRAELNNIAKGNMPPSRSGQCFLACMTKRMGVVNSENKISINRLKQMIKPFEKDANPEMLAKMEQIITSCVNDTTYNNDACVYTTNVTGCVVTSVKQAGLIRLPSR